MRESKFSDRQNVGILTDAEADVAFNNLLRKHSANWSRFFEWRRNCIVGERFGRDAVANAPEKTTKIKRVTQT